MPKEYIDVASDHTSSSQNGIMYKDCTPAKMQRTHTFEPKTRARKRKYPQGQGYSKKKPMIKTGVDAQGNSIYQEIKVYALVDPPVPVTPVPMVPLAVDVNPVQIAPSAEPLAL
jgi:hypothetical protein